MFRLLIQTHTHIYKHAFLWILMVTLCGAKWLLVAQLGEDTCWDSIFVAGRIRYVLVCAAACEAQELWTSVNVEQKCLKCDLPNSRPLILSLGIISYTEYLFLLCILTSESIPFIHLLSKRSLFFYLISDLFFFNDHFFARRFTFFWKGNAKHPELVSFHFHFIVKMSFDSVFYYFVLAQIMH